jgi:hypothetical protein
MAIAALMSNVGKLLAWWREVDCRAGDLWYFASGIPHSIQGLGPDGCEFLLVFDDGDFDEDDTFVLSDWFKHTPNDVLPTENP